MSELAMGFVGVDTANSSIMKVFPLWSDRLGLPTRELRGTTCRWMRRTTPTATWCARSGTTRTTSAPW